LSSAADQIEALVLTAFITSVLRLNQLPSDPGARSAAQLLSAVQTWLSSQKQHKAREAFVRAARTFGRIAGPGDPFARLSVNKQAADLRSLVEEWLAHTGNACSADADALTKHRARVAALPALVATFSRMAMSPLSPFCGEILKKGRHWQDESAQELASADVTSAFRKLLARATEPDPEALVKAGLRAMGVSAAKAKDVFTAESRAWKKNHLLLVQDDDLA